MSSSGYEVGVGSNIAHDNFKLFSAVGTRIFISIMYPNATFGPLFTITGVLADFNQYSTTVTQIKMSNGLISLEWQGR